MAFPSKFKVTTATGKKNVFNLSHTHITTSDFGIIKPVYMRYLVPGDEFKIDISSICRLMPMPCPTYGNIEVISRAFFVPCRNIMRHFNDFISNNLVTTDAGTSENIQSPLYTTVNDIVNVFTNVSYGLMKQQSSAPHDGHIEVQTINGSTPGDVSRQYFTLTPKGRRVYDFCNSIGLHFPWVKTSSSAPLNAKKFGEQKINLLPILAFWKFYLDWIVPSRFVVEYNAKLKFFEILSNSSNARVSSAKLATLFEPFYSYYGDDFFTGAFLNPFGNESINAGAVSIPNPAFGFGQFASDNYNSISVVQNTQQGFGTQSNGAGAHTDVGQDDTYINYFTLQSLGALQHMVNNGKIAGTKLQDYFKLTYNIDIDPKVLQISTYLGKHSYVIQIGDIMSQAGTEFNELGQYAGKGIGGTTSQKFSYETKEHGYFFVTNEIIVKPSYVDGLAHEFQMKDRLDMFAVPELDNLGVEAISLSDIQNRMQNPAGACLDGSTSPETVFGFTPRFSRYKVQQDNISGDFCCTQLNANLKSWYFKRYLEYENSNAWLHINSKFAQADADQLLNNYDYIFNVANNESDHFYMKFDLNVTAIRPMQTIAEALEVEHNPKQGVTTTAKLNGSVE